MYVTARASIQYLSSQPSERLTLLYIEGFAAHGSERAGHFHTRKHKVDPKYTV